MGLSGNVLNSLVHLKGTIELHPHFVVVGPSPSKQNETKKKLSIFSWNIIYSFPNNKNIISFSLLRNLQEAISNNEKMRKPHKRK
jgi:hypothetical protein